MKKFLIFFLSLATYAYSATWYVDNTATGTNNGTSWTDAWTSLSAISGVGPGDTVYISGGPAGGSGQTYSVPSGGWTPLSGSAGSPITYQIGQDSSHDGVATFAPSGTDPWISGEMSYVVITGQLSSDPAFVLSRGASPNQHFALSATLDANTNPVIDVLDSFNLQFSYINFGNQETTLMDGGTDNPVHTVQIDHCYFYKTVSSVGDGTSLIWLDQNTLATEPFNDTEIFDNVIWTDAASNSPDGNEGDTIFGPTPNTTGVTIHDNNFLSYEVDNYSAGEHQDGAQILGGTNIKFYNNYCENFLNYPFYGDALYSGFNNLFVFNNIIVLTAAYEITNPGGPQGIAIGSEMSNAPFSNIIVSNNLIADYTEGQPAINLGNGGSGTISFGANVGLWNNVATNGDGDPVFGNVGNSSVTNVNNVNLNISNGSGYFVSYTQGDAEDANFNLTSPDTTLIQAGTNLSSWASTCPEIMYDRAGNSRPASGAWDIGPYQYVGSSPTPTPTPPPVAFVQENNGVQATSGTTLFVTYNSNVTAGDLLVVFVNDSNIAVSGVTANGNPMSEATSGGANGVLSTVWYLVSPVSGSVTIQATFASATNTGEIVEYEFSGLAGVLDGTPNSRTGNSPYPTSRSITTSNSTDLLFGCAAIVAGPQFGNSGWNFLATINSNMAEYDIVSSTGTYKARFTQSSSAYWAASIVAFK